MCFFADCTFHLWSAPSCCGIPRQFKRHKVRLGAATQTDIECEIGEALHEVLEAAAENEFSVQQIQVAIIIGKEEALTS